MNIEHIREEIIKLSGSGKRVVSTRTHGLYSSFTLRGLEDLTAVRDTERRFRDFGIPENLEGKTFLDLGSNVGAMSFEAALRGAKVTGVEYRDDRVYLSNIIAQKWGLDATFYQADFNSGETQTLEWCKPYDIVLCCSVDEYIDDHDTFYELLRDLCDDQLYFECNVQKGRTVEDTLKILDRVGFPFVTYLGSGHSGGISRKRKIYRAKIYDSKINGVEVA